MATISAITLRYTSDSGNTWYDNPSSAAWYASSSTAANRVCYVFTVTPDAGSKITKISFTCPVRKKGSSGGTSVSGSLSMYLYEGGYPTGSAITSASKWVTFNYYSTDYYTIELTIPDSAAITEETTFCIAVYTATQVYAWTDASASVTEQQQALVHIGDGASFNNYQARIGNGTSFDMYAAYIGDGTNWNPYSG